MYARARVCVCEGGGGAAATKAFRFFSVRVVLRLRRSVSVWADDGRYARSVVSRTHLRIATTTAAACTRRGQPSRPRADRRRHLHHRPTDPHTAISVYSAAIPSIYRAYTRAYRVYGRIYI